MQSREALLHAALAAVLPYAESRVEDMAETPDADWFKARAVFLAASAALAGGAVEPPLSALTFIQGIARMRPYEEGGQYGADPEATCNSLIAKARRLLGYEPEDSPVELASEVGRDEAAAAARDAGAERLLTPETRIVLGLLAWSAHAGGHDSPIWRRAERFIRERGLFVPEVGAARNPMSYVED